MKHLLKVILFLTMMKSNTNRKLAACRLSALTRGTIPFLSLSASLFLVSSFDAQAAEYFVSPKGSDSGSGSQARPWKTIAKAVSRLKAGDTLNLRAGRYREQL